MTTSANIAAIPSRNMAARLGDYVCTKTMTSAAAETTMTGHNVVDALSDVDFEASPVCEVEFVTTKGRTWAPRCNNPAAWWGVTACCGDRGLYCDSCKRRVEGYGGPHYSLDICAVCGGRGMRWTKL